MNSKKRKVNAKLTSGWVASTGGVLRFVKTRSYARAIGSNVVKVNVVSEKTEGKPLGWLVKYRLLQEQHPLFNSRHMARLFGRAWKVVKAND